MEANRCAKIIYDRWNFRGRHCYNKPINDSPFCKIHSPEYIAIKKQKGQQERDKEYEVERAKWHRQEVIRALCEPYSTEWLEANANLIASAPKLDRYREYVDAKIDIDEIPLRYEEFEEITIAKAEG